jgi:hypothetical protein
MSEQSGGPGWWQASDGKWYPPEQAPTAVQPGVGPTSTPPAFGAPAYGAPVAGAPVAGAAAAGGGGAGKVIAIVVVLALLAGGGAYLLTRDSGGTRTVSSFCTKAKSAQTDIKFEDILDPSKVDALLSAFDQLAKSAPDEIKSDMNTLNDALKRERVNVKAGKSPDDGFNASDEEKLTTAAANVEKFTKDKCGIDINSSISSDGSFSFSSFDSSSFESSLSDQFSNFDTDSLSSQLSSLCSEFGSEFCTS